MCISEAQRREKEIKTDRPVSHSPKDKLLTQLCWTADYTSGRQNLEKMMLDNQIACMDHYWEPSKFEKVSAV